MDKLMKNKLSLLMFVFFLVASTTLGFTSNHQVSLNQRLLAKPNRVYFGPEFLSFQIDTHVRDVHVDGNTWFWGLRFGYEYLKPKALYAAAEILATNAHRDFRMSDDFWKYNGKGCASFGSLQTRFGYNFSSNHYLMTPYLGLGTYYLSKHGHYGFLESIGCLSAGLRTQFACSSRCVIALNTEFFRTLGVKQSATIKDQKATRHTNGFGCNVATPLTIRLSTGWDMQLNPYYLRLLFAENQNIYGINLLFGYRF